MNKSEYREHHAREAARLWRLIANATTLAMKAPKVLTKLTLWPSLRSETLTQPTARRVGSALSRLLLFEFGRQPVYAVPQPAVRVQHELDLEIKIANGQH